VSVQLLKFDGVQIQETPAELRSMIQALARDVQARYEGVALGEIPAVKAVRSIFHRTGVDPTRYRPSSEALLRRVVKGQGLYFINSAVDVVNYFSLKTLVPMGLFDADQIQGEIEFRAGRAGETYEGVGRAMLNLEGFPLLADAVGPFGSAVSDSTRTRVTSASRRLLWVIFAPAGINMDFAELSETMLMFNGGSAAAPTSL
jgi:DNA/RNA-binding domain of Phe-tRNA-synthetase-like protein